MGPGRQALKVSQGKVPRCSGYNPLDLFSLEPGPMRAALTALLHCPANNLRLFRNGRCGAAAGQLQSRGSQLRGCGDAPRT